MTNNIKWIICHHSGATDYNRYADTANQSFEDVNAWHRDAKDENGQPRYHYGQPSSLGYYLAYHYFIDRNGKVTQARADSEKGFHTIGYNEQSLGIVLAGNFDVYLPTWPQTLALKNLLVSKSAQYGVPLQNIVPHRKFSQKSCFGARLSDWWASDLVADSTGERITLMKQLLIHLQALLSLLQKRKIRGADKGCDSITTNN